jgi:hypothetical protein
MSRITADAVGATRASVGVTMRIQAATIPIGYSTIPRIDHTRRYPLATAAVNAFSPGVVLSACR